MHLHWIHTIGNSGRWLEDRTSESHLRYESGDRDGRKVMIKLGYWFIWRSPYSETCCMTGATSVSCNVRKKTDTRRRQHILQDGTKLVHHKV